MAFSKVLTVLLALVALTVAARVNKIPLNLSGNKTTWNSVYEGHCSTSAHLKCNGDGTVTLKVRSPSAAHRVEVQAVLPFDNTRSPAQYPSHPNKALCSASFETPNFPAELALVPEECPNAPPAGVVNLNEDYEQWLIEQAAQQVPEQHDMNADYADYLESMRERSGMGRSGVRASAGEAPGALLKLSIEACGSGAASANGNRYEAGDVIVLVTEYLTIPAKDGKDSLVDLVTNTTVALSCDICHNSPEGGYEPVVKSLETAQCQQSRYSLAARATETATIVNISQSNPGHPDSDDQLGWQLAQLSFGNDTIVEDREFTPVGKEIDGKYISPANGRWANDLQSYQIETDNVSEQGKNPRELGIKASIGYCFNSLLSAGVETCATPQC